MKRESKTSEIKFPEFQAALLSLQGDRTIEEFANKVGLSRATIGFYISGSRLPDAKRILQIAKKCDVSADYLLGLTKIPSANVEIRKICEYTGLEEYSVNKLHALNNSKAEQNTIIEFINSLLCDRFDRGEKYLDAISESIFCAAWAEANSAREDQETLDIDDYFDRDEIERALIMKKIKEKSDSQHKQTMDAIFTGKAMVPIPANDVAILYTKRAKTLLETIVEDTIGIFEQRFEKQLLASKKKK